MTSAGRLLSGSATRRGDYPTAAAAIGASAETLPPRALSVAEWQAAADALRRGDFARYGPVGPPHGQRAEAGLAAGGGADSEALGVPAVLVLAAHSGAGASTVAAATAEGLVGRGQRVRLVDCADPAHSGLAAATTTELGTDPAGWRRGRRGDVEVDRLAWPSTALTSLPRPRAATGPAAAAGLLLVVDVGWPSRDVLSAVGWLGRAVADSPLLLVCRASVPGVRHAEHLLGRLDCPAVVAAVGAGRWPGPVTASFGPALRAGRAARRLVLVPADRRLEITGLSAEPLPKPVTAAGKALAALLFPDQPVLTGLSVTPAQGATDAAIR